MIDRSSLTDLQARVSTLERELSMRERWRGTYFPGQVYVPQDQVMYNGIIYQALSQNFNVPPDSNGSIWLRISAASSSNGLHNALFRVNQQGNTTVTANGSPLADRWIWGQGNTSSYQCSLTSQNPRLESGTLLDNTYEIKRLDGTALASNAYVEIYTRVEGTDWRLYHGSPLVVSFLAWATVAGQYPFGMRSSNADRSFVSLYTLPAQTWTKIEILIPAPSSAGGTWTFDTTASAILDWTADCGSAFTVGTNNAWVSANALAPTGWTSPITAANQYLYIASPKLETGTNATPLIPPPFAVDQLICERYYQKLYVNQHGYTDSGAGGHYLMTTRTITPLRTASPTITHTMLEYKNSSSAIAQPDWFIAVVGYGGDNNTLRVFAANGNASGSAPNIYMDGYVVLNAWLT